MLRHLFIKNFALIQEVSIDFNQGYTVFTGETGSGKSIFLNALNLILGERADYKVIGPDQEKAIVEATFDLSRVDIQPLFEQHDIDFETETIIRREITKQGKSRTFVNDIPVPLTTLKEITSRLVSIHSQYNTLDLKRKDYQLFVLDILAGTFERRKTFEQQFNEVQRLKKELQDREEALFEQTKNQDFVQFQLTELAELELENTQYDSLETQLKTIENAGEIVQLSDQLSAIFTDDKGILSLLAMAKVAAQRLSSLDEKNANQLDRILSLEIEAKDLAGELGASIDLELTESEVQMLIAKMDRYNNLLRKHRLSNQEELLDLYNNLAQSVAGSEELQEQIDALKVRVQKEEESLRAEALTLHKQRVAPIDELQKHFAAELTALKLPNTQIKFEISELSEPVKTGISDLKLLFSANVGMEPVAIENAASGGELSRVMLVIQKLISERIALPTIFFDEIDTGVSGDVAQRMGDLLAQMGVNMQLFAISHLPQVAAKAQFHYKVEKSIMGDRTLTQINPVLGDDRVVEIARLMSGDVVNDAAMENARLLMR